MHGYVIVIEKAGANWSAYVPDLPGCITTGATPEECERNMAEAVSGHIATMREFGDPIPEPSTQVSRVEVAAA
ncbi:MAG: type II toxin-antitoxin system HicB family antitoxin [Fimbriimonas sp.]